ncbi:MAG: HAD-IIA family hydrolase [Candidatus Eisenbacteria bacterium]|uniref:HAD-IIA family hydrolase n=1 Tax=Eiseniibacteriota bacterium TaxID=2212470 RepID=A0A948W2N7_UNCEI|nr:HAD-IIA family hydrolase [Candidatus Eisenbacteria bacterium]MBU1948159.1 HAD-IIA family hydrolase [Candidatus Eisenbacteria bacterium]MBU2690172.1 HAD-IIA family hydrolase [Candidatus Eisenbacteria bacterium]
MVQQFRSEFDPAQIKGLLLDLDGVIYQGHRLIAGNKKAFRMIRDRETPVLFITNTTSVSRLHLREKLRGLGLSCSPEEILNAPRAAAEFLHSKGIRKCLLLAPETCADDFIELGIDPHPPESGDVTVPAVVVGDLGERFTFPVMNKAFLALREGALFVSMSPNRYWMSPNGLVLDSGPYVAALEYAIGRKALLTAKPNPSIFLEACRLLKLPPENVLMVGDDVEVDIDGAQKAGLPAVLVKTGKYQRRDETLIDPPPHGVVKNLLELMTHLGE